MKVYLQIKTLVPVNFFCEGTGYQAAAGELIHVNSRFQRPPAGISAEVAVRMVRAEEAELAEWAEIDTDGRWQELAHVASGPGGRP